MVSFNSIQRQVSSVLVALLIPCAGQANATDNSLQHWTDISLANNPAIKSAYYDWESQKSRRDSAGALPDPTLNVDYFVDEVQTRTGPQEYRLMLAQKLPWFGKRQVASDIAAAMANGAESRLQETRLQIARQLTHLWAEGVYLERDHAITRENLALLEQIERIARTRYRLARAGHPDLIRVQLQRSKVENQLGALERDRLDLISRLTAISQQDVAASFRWPAQFPALPELPDSDTLKNTLREANPALIALRHHTTAKTRQTKAAQLQQRPDITVKYGRIFTGEAMNPGTEGSGKDPQYIGIGINIPLWLEKNRHLENAAHQSRLQAEANLKNAERLLVNQLESAMHKYRDAQSQLERFEYALIPQAQDALTSLLKSYQTGSSDFSDLLETEKLLLTLKKEQANLKKVLWQAFADIQTLTAEAAR